MQTGCVSSSQLFVLQGNKCLADICRPVARQLDDGTYGVVKPTVSDALSCCLMTVQSQSAGNETCALLEVCEDKTAPVCVLTRLQCIGPSWLMTSRGHV